MEHPLGIYSSLVLLRRSLEIRRIKMLKLFLIILLPLTITSFNHQNFNLKDPTIDYSAERRLSGATAVLTDGDIIAREYFKNYPSLLNRTLRARHPQLFASSTTSKQLSNAGNRKALGFFVRRFARSPEPIAPIMAVYAIPPLFALWAATNFAPFNFKKSQDIVNATYIEKIGD
jgi:hypothetical protein